MIAIITADIIHSRGMLPQKGLWLDRLKAIFDRLQNQLGYTQYDWDIFRGDSFQLRLEKTQYALFALIAIRAGLKAFEPFYNNKMDLRAAIGLGEEQFRGKTVSESDGPAYQYSGLLLDALKSGKSDIGLKSDSEAVNSEMQSSLPLANAIMSDWSLTGAQTVWYWMEHRPTQTQMGAHFGTSQAAISQRLSRAHLDELIGLCDRYAQLAGQMIAP